MNGREEQKDEDERFTMRATQGPKASQKLIPSPPRERPSGLAPGPMGLMGTFLRKLCKWVLQSTGGPQDTLSAVGGGWKEYVSVKSFSVALHSNVASLI